MPRRLPLLVRTLKILHGRSPTLRMSLQRSLGPRHEREHRACFEELTLLQIRGSELFHAIISPPRAKHLSEGMRLAALRHIEIVGELTAFQAAVSSIMESVLGRSPGNTALAVVVGELVAEFQKFEDRRSRLELPSQGSATCYLGHYLAGPGWPTILMRPLDSSMWS
jgi:hypothetical protein